MARKPKTNRVPRTRANGEWTEAQFWGFIRSALRGASRRWGPLVRHAPNAVRRAYHGPNKRQKWEYECSQCGGWFMRKEVQVDHIEPCGSLKSFDEMAEFAERLFCETDGLQVLCKASCHDTKTQAAKVRSVKRRPR